MSSGWLRAPGPVPAGKETGGNDAVADVARRLAEFARGLQVDDLPAFVRQQVKDILLDALACGLLGRAGDELPGLAAACRRLGEDRAFTVIGGDGASLAGAVLLNGYLVTALTACDVHRPSGAHLSPAVLPAALAVAEREGAAGSRLLVSLAAGFEVMARLGRALRPPSLRRRGWLTPGITGPFGAAVAAGVLLQLDLDGHLRAMGLAASQAGGTAVAWGTPMIKFHQCRAALAGLLAALLASEGFGSTRDPIESADGGLLPVYAEGGDPEAAVADLGQRWELMEVSLRRWPATSLLQPMVTALLELRAHDFPAWRDVARLEVALPGESFELHGQLPEPQGKFQCLQSAHYLAAVLALDGDLWLQQLSEARMGDPELRRFMRERVQVVADPALPRGAARVLVTAADGTRRQATCQKARGEPGNRLPREEVEEKFRRAASGILAPKAAEAVIEQVRDLEAVSDVRPWVRSLRSSR